MIATLVRQDPARRVLPALLLGGVMTGLLVRTLFPLVQARGGSGRPTVLMLLVAVWWVTAAFLFFRIVVDGRCSRLALALPVPARTLWWVRMGWVIVCGLAPAALVILLASVRFDRGEGLAIEGVVALAGARAGAALLLLALLLQLPRPRLDRIPPTRGYLVWAGASVIVTGILAFAGRPSPAWVLALLAAAAVLLIVSHRSIPDAFTVASSEVEEGRETRAIPPRKRRETETVAPRRKGSSLLIGWMIHWRSPAWIVLPLIVLYGALVLHAYRLARDPLPIIVFIVVWIPYVVFMGILRLGPLDHLPIPRRRMFRWIAIPPVLAIVVGLLAYDPAARIAGSNPALVSFCCTRGLDVPYEFWEVAWDGQAPAVISPWGETHTPKAYTVLPGLGAAVYSPFEAPDEASGRFRALQARRALAVVYGDGVEERPGAPSSLDAVAEKRLERGEKRPVPGSLDRGSSLHASTFLLLGVIPLAFWGASMGIALRAGGSRRARTVLVFTLLAVPIVLVIVMEFASMAAGTPRPPGSVLVLVLARKAAEAIPLGPVPLAAVLVLAAAAVYVAMARSFERVEVTDRPGSCGTTAWGALRSS